MNPMFQKLIEKKQAEGKGFSPVEKQASDSVIADLMHFLNSAEADKVKGLKKVTVASNDPKGLEDGLAQAKAMVAGKDDPTSTGDDTSTDDSVDDDDFSDEDDSDDNADPHGTDDMAHDPVANELANHEVHDADNEEDIKNQIAMLQAKLASKGPGRI